MQLAPTTTPTPGFIPPPLLIDLAIHNLSNAQGLAADMLNAKQFDSASASSAITQIKQGVGSLDSIPPGDAGFTRVDTAREQALEAAASFQRAISIGFNWGGTNSPNGAQLKATSDAFNSLENALEALNND